MALVSAMWNHATTMREQFTKKRLSWSEMTTQDLADMLVYLQGSALGAQRGRPY